MSHHESWYNWLLELSFEGVHQLLCFGIVERQNTCTEQTRTDANKSFISFINISIYNCLVYKISENSKKCR